MWIIRDLGYVQETADSIEDGKFRLNYCMELVIEIMPHISSLVMDWSIIIGVSLWLNDCSFWHDCIVRSHFLFFTVIAN
jgi:hypothetical protein